MREFEDELKQEGYKWVECRDCPFFGKECEGVPGLGGCYAMMEELQCRMRDLS